MSETRYDVFISHATEDRLVAEAICHHFESLGVRCFLARSQILAGMDWQTELTMALKASRALVLVFSKHSNESPNVHDEIYLAIEAELHIIRFKLEDADLHPELLRIQRKHWLEAINPPTAEQIQRLGSDVCKLLGIEPKDPFGPKKVVAPDGEGGSVGTPPKKPTAPPEEPGETPPRKKGEDGGSDRKKRSMNWVAAVLVGLGLAVVAPLAWNHFAKHDEGQPQKTQRLAPEAGRMLAMNGEEVKAVDSVPGFTHSQFKGFGFGMTVPLLLDNKGKAVDGLLTVEWLLPRNLKPTANVREELKADPDGFVWKSVLTYGDGTVGIPKGAASESHGYRQVMLFCPLEDAGQILFNAPMRVGCNLRKANGELVFTEKFKVTLSPQSPATEPRVEVATIDGQIEAGTWVLKGTVDASNVDFPVTVSIPAKIRNVGVLTTETVATVWMLPEALRPADLPSQKPNRTTPKSFAKTGLPWFIGWNWHFGSGPVVPALFEMPLQFPLDPSFFSREKPRPVEPGLYHVKMVIVRDAELSAALEGRLPKDLLYERDFTIDLSQPSVVQPRPAPYQLEIPPNVPGYYPRIKAIAFRKSEVMGMAEYGVFMPVRVKNRGTTPISGLKLRSLVFLSDAAQVSEAMSPSNGATPRKLGLGEMYGFTYVTGPWNFLVDAPLGQTDLAIPAGGTAALKTGFYVGKPDALPSSQVLSKEMTVGLKIFSVEDEASNTGVLMFSGQVTLDMEWRDTLDRAAYLEFLDKAGPITP